MPEHTQETEILQLNQRLLDAIAAADWATYEELCDPGYIPTKVRELS